MNNVIVWLLQWILPRRLWYRRLYLRSKHWREFRQRIGQARGWRCFECSRRGTDVHHLVYHLWHETARDVRLLCREHHRLEHVKG